MWGKKFAKIVDEFFHSMPVNPFRLRQTSLCIAPESFFYRENCRKEGRTKTVLPLKMVSISKT